MGESENHNTIDEYFQDQPDAIIKALQELRECILQAAPDAAETLDYNIPAFTLVE